MKKGKKYVIRHEDGLFVTMSEVNKDGKTFKVNEAYSWSSAEQALDYYRMTKDGDSLFEKRGDKVYFVGSFHSIGMFGLEKQLADLKERDETEVYVCPDCDWETEHDNYTRCQACWANGDRTTLDTVIKSEREREEYERITERLYMSSLHLYKVTLWNGDEVHPDAEIVLTTARSETEAMQKVEKKKPSAEYKATEAEIIKEIDGFNILLQRKQ